MFPVQCVELEILHMFAPPSPTSVKDGVINIPSASTAAASTSKYYSDTYARKLHRTTTLQNTLDASALTLTLINVSHYVILSTKSERQYDARSHTRADERRAYPGRGRAAAARGRQP